MSNLTGREPQLSSAIQQKKGGLRRLSLRRLGTMLNVLPPDSVSLDAAEEMLKSEEFYVRYNAAILLSKRGDRDARLIMEKAIRHGELRTRASVARHLYGFSWFSAEPLIALALKDNDPRVREGAVYALCDLQDLNAYRLLTDILPAEDDTVKEAAAVGLRDCQDPEAVPVLEIVMTALDPDVRVKALEALGVNGNKSAMPVVRDGMNDPEPFVRYAATLSLLELAGEDWLEELAGVIGRTNGETLEQVLLGFFHATNYLKIDVAQSHAADLLIDSLETALLDELPQTRKAAIWPLAWIRHERMPEILKRTYHIEQDVDVKAHIVRVAAGLMSEASEQILADAKGSKIDEVREMANTIILERERSGIILEYDHEADDGIAFKKASLGKT